MPKEKANRQSDRLRAIQDVPLELEWHRGEGQVDPLTRNVLGQYQAILGVTRAGK